MGFEMYVLAAAVVLFAVLGAIALISRRRRLRDVERSEVAEPEAAEPEAPTTAAAVAIDDESAPRPRPSPSAAPPAGEVQPLEDERKYQRTFVDAWLGDDDEDGEGDDAHPGDAGRTPSS